MSKDLLGSQNAGTLLLSRTLALQTLVKSDGVAVITTKVVEILDFEDTDDPVLTGKCLLEGVEFRAFRRQSYATNTVNGLSGGEKRVVVVIGHFVPMERLVRDYFHEIEGRGAYIKLFFMAGVASSSTRYSPRAVKKSRSLTSSGQIPSAIRTIHKNLLMSSPE